MPKHARRRPNATWTWLLASRITTAVWSLEEFGSFMCKDNVREMRKGDTELINRYAYNPNMIWLSSRRACYLYLISVLTRCLPLEEHGFFNLYSCFFPNHGLIEHMSPEEDPGRWAVITLRKLIATLQFT